MRGCGAGEQVVGEQVWGTKVTEVGRAAAGREVGVIGRVC